MTCVRFSTLALAGAASLVITGAAAAQRSESDDQHAWSGAYAGLNAGWQGWTSYADPSLVTVNQLTGVSAGAGPVTVAPTTVVFPAVQNNTSSPTWGGQVGMSVQTGNLVWGLEGDINALYGNRPQVGFFTLPATALTTGGTLTVARATNPHWMGTVRARIGWARDPLLFYGTGGVAFARVRETASYTYAPTVTSAVMAANPATTFGPFSSASSVSNTRTGWVAGAGVEWRYTQRLSFAVEYKHAGFGKKALALFGSTLPNGVFERPLTGFTDDMVTVKVNYRFAGPLF